MTDEEKKYLKAVLEKSYAYNGLRIIEELEKENAELKAVCDYNCPDHKLATHNACLMCPAIRNSPYHDLKNVSDEELQKIIKEAEEEMEM